MTTLTPQEVELVLGKQLWLICPHCKTGQRVMSWKDNDCRYLKCDVKKFDAQISDTQIVREVLKMARENEDKPKRYYVQKEPKLQKFGDGSHRLVQQGGEWRDHDSNSHS